MTDSVTNPGSYSPWLHRWAWLTVLAVFPLVALGGLVTSLRVGMADTEPLRVPWYMLTLSWRDTADAHGIGYLIEHSHRQVGWIVGVLTIVLAIWLLAAARKNWLRGLGILALLGVSVQGILGALRVYLDRAGLGTEFAMVHGVMGQLVFALLACIVLFTSRSWIEGPRIEARGAARFRKMCRLTMLLMLAQLVVGVWLRQEGQGAWGAVLILHVLLALAILSHVVMLALRVYRSEMRQFRLFSTPVRVLNLLVLAQIALGLATWLLGAGEGAFDHREVTAWRAATATGHVGIGAMALASMAILLFRSYRHLQVDAAPVSAKLGTTEALV